MQVQGHKCINCSRVYKEKFNFDRHAVYCDFLQKSAREQENKVELVSEPPPTTKQLYRWMQEMALRIDKLEKENMKLRKIHTKKINILEWLNKSPKPDISFTEWIKRDVFILVHKYLETVFQENLMIGIYTIFCEVMKKKKSNLPLRAFTKKNNMFYVFMENKGWIIASTELIDSHLAHIAHRFIIEFKNHWYIPNESKIETDEKYQDLYINYYQQILGGTDKYSEEVRYEKIRKLLYKKMAENLEMVEYEICNQTIDE